MAACFLECVVLGSAVRTLKGLALPAAHLVLLGPSRSVRSVFLARTRSSLMLCDGVVPRV